MLVCSPGTVQAGHIIRPISLDISSISPTLTSDKHQTLISARHLCRTCLIYIYVLGSRLLQTLDFPALMTRCRCILSYQIHWLGKWINVTPQGWALTYDLCNCVIKTLSNVLKLPSGIWSIPLTSVLFITIWSTT